MLAWMDLEMTGLDPSADAIVEIATLVTDDDLGVIAEGPDLVVTTSPEQLAAMEDVVRQMHTQSGLLAEIESSTLSLEEAGKLTLEFLMKHIRRPNSVPLCGNSIGTDRRFLAAQLPDVDNYLHYRSVDVSTIKELVRRWYPQTSDATPKKVRAHRAMGDIYESIEELRFYRRNIFR